MIKGNFLDSHAAVMASVGKAEYTTRGSFSHVEKYIAYRNEKESYLLLSTVFTSYSSSRSCHKMIIIILDFLSQHPATKRQLSS